MSVVVPNVSGMTSGASRDDDVLPSRPAKEAVREIFVVSAVGLFIVFVLAALPGGNEGVYRAMGLAPVAGAVVLEHIGWAFGAYIPILLGFYAIVIGGQLVADPTTASRTRRTLGLVAETMTGVLVPALVLILAACIADPSQAGALFVILPVAGVMFFLAIQLGAFIVFERAEQLASAERARDRAKERLPALRQRSRKPIWLVVTVNAIAGGLLGTGTTLAITRPTGSVVALLGLYALIGLVLGFASAHGMYLFRTAQDRTSRVMAWAFPTALYLAGIMLAVQLFVTSGPAGGTSVLVIVAFSVASTLWPRKGAPRFILNWTIQGATTGYAAKTITSTYVTNVRKIRELIQTPDADEPATLRDRIVAVFQAFRRVAPGRAT